MRDIHSLPQQLPVLNDDALVGAPAAQGDGMQAVTGWLMRYRNRVLLWAFFYTLAFIPFQGSFYALGMQIFFTIWYPKPLQNADIEVIFHC